MIELVGLLAAACILSASVPQVIALVRHGAEGVSLGSWSLLLATSTVWAAYGFRIESPSTVAGNIGGAVAFTVVVALLLRARTGSAAAPVLIAPALAAVFAAAWWAPLGVTAVVAVGLGFSLAVPQLLASVRSWRAARESEVALGAWGLLLTGQVLWLTYGVATAEWAIVIVNIVAAASSTAILIVESRNRRRVNAA